MGKITCNKCGATSLAETFEQADDQIDHSVGVSRGKPCDGNPIDITWDKSFEIDDDGNIIASSPKPVASVVFHFGPGSKKSSDEIDTEPVYEPNSSPKKNKQSTKRQ